MSRYEIGIDFAQAYGYSGILYSYDGVTYSSIGSGEVSRDVVEAAVHLSSSWRPASPLVSVIAALDVPSAQRVNFVLYASGIQALYPRESVPSLGRFIVSRACRVLAPNRTDSSLQGVFLDENDTSNYSAVLDAYLADALIAFLDSQPVKSHVLAVAAAYNPVTLTMRPSSSETFRCSENDASLDLRVLLDISIQYTLDESDNSRTVALFDEPVTIYSRPPEFAKVQESPRFPRRPCESSYSANDPMSLHAYSAWASHDPDTAHRAFDGLSTTYWETSDKYQGTSPATPRYADTDMYSPVLDTEQSALYGDWLHIYGTEWFQATHLAITTSNISQIAVLGQASGDERWQVVDVISLDPAAEPGRPSHCVVKMRRGSPQPHRAFRIVVLATLVERKPGRIYDAYLEGHAVGDPALLAANIAARAAETLPERHTLVIGSSGDLAVMLYNDAARMYDLARVDGSSLFGRRVARVACGGGAYAACLDTLGEVHAWPFAGITNCGVEDALSLIRAPVRLKTAAQNRIQFSEVSCGASCAFALENSTGRVWGARLGGPSASPLSSDLLIGNYGQLGALNPMHSITSPLVSLSKRVGRSHMLAVDASGKAVAWGSNSHGQLGIPVDECPFASPDQGAVRAILPDPIHVVSVCAGDDVSYAIDAEGHVYSWGSAWYGRLGDGSPPDASGWLDRPTDISVVPGSSLAGERMVAIACNEWAAIALDATGRLHAWGSNVWGTLGSREPCASLPVCISDVLGSSLTGRRITAVSMSQTQVVAVDIEGGLHTWGGGTPLPRRPFNFDLMKCLYAFPSASKPPGAIYSQSHREFGSISFAFYASSTGMNGAPQLSFGENQYGSMWASSPGNYDAASGLYAGSSVTVCTDGTAIRGEWVQVVCSGASLAARLLVLDGVGQDLLGAGIDAFTLVGLPAGEVSDTPNGGAWVPIVARSDLHGLSGSMCIRIEEHRETFATFRCIVQRTWNDAGITYASIHALVVYGELIGSALNIADETENAITCSASSNSANAIDSMSGTRLARQEWSGSMPYNTTGLPDTELGDGSIVSGEWLQIHTAAPMYPHLLRLSLGSSGGSAVVVGSLDGASDWVLLGATQAPQPPDTEGTVDIAPLARIESPLHAVRVIVTSLAIPSATATLSRISVIGSRDGMALSNGLSWSAVMTGADPVAASVDASDGGLVTVAGVVADASGVQFGESREVGCRGGDALVAVCTKDGRVSWIAALSGGSPRSAHRFRDCAIRDGLAIAAGSTGNSTCIIRNSDGSTFAAFPRTRAASNPIIVAYSSDASGQVAWAVGLAGDANFTDEDGESDSGPYFSLVECTEGKVVVAGAFAGRLTTRDSSGTLLLAPDDENVQSRSFLLALDAMNGRPCWATYQGSGIDSCVYPRAMCVAPDGKTIFLCVHGVRGMYYDAVSDRHANQAIHKYSGDGDLEWVTGADGVIAMACGESGVFTLSRRIGALGGLDAAIGPNAPDVVAVEKRSDASGTIVWVALCAGMRPVGVMATGDGGVIVQANCNSEASGLVIDATPNYRKTSLNHAGGVLIKYSAVGMVQWVSKMSGSLTEGTRFKGSSSCVSVPMAARLEGSTEFQLYGPDASPCIRVKEAPAGSVIMASVPLGEPQLAFADRLPNPGSISNVYYERQPELTQGNISSIAFSWGRHVLAIDTSGRVYAWGRSIIEFSNFTNPAGPGYIYKPVLLSSMGSLVGAYVSSVATGLAHSLALDASGCIHAWGYNALGQLGTGSTINCDYPVVVGSGSLAIARRQGARAVSVHAGYYWSAALMSDGSVHMWGDNSNGQLGNNSATTGYSSRPVRTSSYGSLQGGVFIQQLSAGSDHILALDASRKVHAWGKNASCQIGNGEKLKVDKPVMIGFGTLQPDSVTVVQVIATYQNSYAIDSSGAVHAWGAAAYNMLGRANTTTNADVPLVVETFYATTGPVKVTAITYGTQQHMLALTTQGDVYAWGLNALNRMGTSANGYTTPTRITDYIPSSIWDAGIAAIYGSTFNTFFLTKSGRLYAAGSNESVQLSATSKQGTRVTNFTEIVFGAIN